MVVSDFQDLEGEITDLGGLTLTFRPSLDQGPRVKFAAFTDSRIFDPILYKLMEPFLPESFEMKGPPQFGQNCFGHVLGRKRVLTEEEFEQSLAKYSLLSFKSRLIPGDIVSYLTFERKKDDTSQPFCTHAGIYVGGGRVQSRWGSRNLGIGSALIEHPIDQIPPNYYNPSFGPCWIAYRKVNSDSLD